MCFRILPRQVEESGGKYVSFCEYVTSGPKQAMESVLEKNNVARYSFLTA